MKVFIRIIGILLLSGSCLVLNAQSAKALKTLADKQYNKANYVEAIDYYEQYEALNPQDASIKSKMGISYYNTNKLRQAKQYLKAEVDNNKKANAKNYYYLALTHHAETDFKQAIFYYKEYLKRIDDGASNRHTIKDAILRCAAGLKIKARKQEAFVENLGAKVNSIYDDFAPIQSPNYEDRLYFSSIREGNLGGLRDEEGFVDEKNGTYKSDMFGTAINNGEWAETAPLSFLLNSPRHDVIFDFSPDGKSMFFFQGLTLYSGNLLVDTFKVDEEKALYSKNFISPVFAEEGDSDLFFYQDSVMLFSSRRDGGYGGKDLYITTLGKDGYWTIPENLGPVINSPYDESTPFLSKDGKTLYYSSNSIKSIGGFDIFKSLFDNKTLSWSSPNNLGLPINSSADDTHFRLGKGCLRAFFSSSRKEGMGQKDIYVAYFKSKRTEHQFEKSSTAFIEQIQQHQAKVVEIEEQTFTDSIALIDETPLETVQFEVAPLFYQESENLGSDIKKTLAEVIKILKKYPEIAVELTAHKNADGPTNFDLYFSIKKAEQLADYLIENGIAEEKIHLRGCGAGYPIAKAGSASGERLNRRINIRFYEAKQNGVEVIEKTPIVSDAIALNYGNYYNSVTKKLCYKVQIAAIQQMYTGDLLTKFSDPIVEKIASQSTYRYTLGLHRTFYSANQMLEEIKKSGIEDAYIVPYIEGKRITTEEAVEKSIDYPDLSAYLQNITEE